MASQKGVTSRHEKEEEVVLFVGSWGAVRTEEEPVSEPGVEIHHCVDPGQILAAAHVVQPDWLLVGAGVDDHDIQQAFSTIRAVREDTRLAILGNAGDWRRCERWLRLGCSVYMQHLSSAARVVTALQNSRELDVAVTDQIFHRVLQSRKQAGVPVLTRREREVLDLLRKGFRNRDIGAALHITENTVEYHMRHLLQKFSARSRLEAVERATALGLA